MPTGLVASFVALFSSMTTAVFRPRWNKASKLGALNLSVTTSGSLASIDSIEAKKALSLLVESLAAARSNENFTSFEENVSPSWNLTPLRKVKVSVLRSGEKLHFSASSGVTEKSSLIFVSPSKML